MLAKLMDEVDQYPSVTRQDGHVVAATKNGDRFYLTVVLTNGAECEFSDAEAAALHRRGIAVHTAAVRRLVGREGQLHRIELDVGTTLEAAAIFYSIGHKRRTGLLEQLGCELGPDGVVLTRCQETTVPGVYAAGDIAPLEELVVVAAAMGAVATNNLHQSLAPAL